MQFIVWENIPSHRLYQTVLCHRLCGMLKNYHSRKDDPENAKYEYIMCSSAPHRLDESFNQMHSAPSIQSESVRRRASRFPISIHANDRFDEITQVNMNMENIHMRPAFNHLHTAPITCLMILGESRMHHYYLPELRYIQYSMLRSNNNHAFLCQKW